MTLFLHEALLFLYDLTNTYLEGSGKHNDLAHRGESKEKRSNAPLMRRTCFPICAPRRTLRLNRMLRHRDEPLAFGSSGDMGAVHDTDPSRGCLPFVKNRFGRPFGLPSDSGSDKSPFIYFGAGLPFDNLYRRTITRP